MTNAIAATEPLAVTIVLDGSGSMFPIRDDTIGGVNDYLSGLPAGTSVTLTVFGGSRYEPIWKGVTNGRRLTSHEYETVGGTPLYDAIGRAIAETPDASKVAFVIVTDGEENSSREFTREAIFELLAKKQEKGWMVIYLGANQDALKVGASFGTQSANTMTYATRNVGDTFGAARRATRDYAATGSAASAGFTDEERKRATEVKNG